MIYYTQITFTQENITPRLRVRLVPEAALLKCGQWQSFLKIPHDDKLIVAIRITMYLTFFIIYCPACYYYRKYSHANPDSISKQIGPFAASPDKDS